MTTGLGLFPCGISPCGFGLPSPAVAVAQGSTGAVASAAVNWRTKDFDVADAYGNPVVVSDAGQRVQMLLTGLFGERPNFKTEGLQLPKGASNRLPALLREYVRRALRPVLEDGTVELLSVIPETVGTTLYALVEWRDTQKETTTTTRQLVSA